MISGILHVLSSGCRWSDGPSEYRPPTSAQGVWKRLFGRLAAAGNIPDEISIDSTHVKAHRSHAEPRGLDMALDRKADVAQGRAGTYGRDATLMAAVSWAKQANRDAMSAKPVG